MPSVPDGTSNLIIISGSRRPVIPDTTAVGVGLSVDIKRFRASDLDKYEDEFPSTFRVLNTRLIQISLAKHVDDRVAF